MYSAFVARGYSEYTSSCKSSHEVGGRGRELGGLPPPDVLPQNWGGTKPNCIVICMMLKATRENTITAMPAIEMRFPHMLTKGENKHRPATETSPHSSRFPRIGFLG
ncbi:hypothetical protein TNCV_128401 [Trichonephila clavipes]|nr:hypothetical protein TNCV_128401 [Trichonephila clavipes]